MILTRQRLRTVEELPSSRIHVAVIKTTRDMRGAVLMRLAMQINGWKLHAWLLPSGGFNDNMGRPTGKLKTMGGEGFWNSILGKQIHPLLVCDAYLDSLVTSTWHPRIGTMLTLEYYSGLLLDVTAPRDSYAVNYQKLSHTVFTFGWGSPRNPKNMALRSSTAPQSPCYASTVP